MQRLIMALMKIVVDGRTLETVKSLEELLMMMKTNKKNNEQQKNWKIASEINF